MKRAALSFSLILLMAMSAQADTVFEHPVGVHEEKQLQVLTRRIAEQAGIQGQFVQDKHLSVLSRPIESKGRFSINNKGQFQWEIQSPFPLSYRFDGEQLVRIQNDNRETISASDDPSLYGFFTFISSLFQQKNAVNLEDYFERFFLSHNNGWTLGLRPTDGRIRRALSDMVVTGKGARIEKAVLMEPNGDYTELRFTYPEPGRIDISPSTP